VRFTRRADAHVYQGFTTNISTTGMFLGTGSPMAIGERLRIEVIDKDRSFAVEGAVVRLHRVSVALRQVAQPGVGIRFLPVAELFQELLPTVTAAPKEAEDAPREQPGQEVVIGTAGLVTVRFNTLEALEKVWGRDLAHGGMFIQTEEPLPVDRELTLEIHVPAPGFAPVRTRARVIHSFTPPKDGLGHGPNLLSGMGVVFEDALTVIAGLKSVIDRYRA